MRELAGPTRWGVAVWAAAASLFHLGAGIPTTAAYVISVVVGAGAMGGLGVPVLAAHLFVF